MSGGEDIEEACALVDGGEGGVCQVVLADSPRHSGGGSVGT